MTTTTIRTRYATHPGSNVGDYRATAHGMRATVRIDQSLPLDRAARAAAVKLAGNMHSRGLLTVPALPAWIPAGDVLVSLEGTATDEGYSFTVLAAWPEEEARRHAAISRQELYRHAHGSLLGESAESEHLTRENCGACVLGGYGFNPEEDTGPNYAAWARTYVQARRTVPEEWRAGFLQELAGGDPVNVPYADALRRDILTYGVAP